MTILERILETKRAELATAMRERPSAEVERAAGRADPPRDFFGSITLRPPHGIHLIAEIKRASQSAGVIVRDFDPVSIARLYHAHGAAALSVLTDETYFQGRLGFIEAVKRALPLPVLRKDFIIDEYQVFESRAAGADAVLLIAEAIGPDRVAVLSPLVSRLGMTPLVEVHTEENLSAIITRLGPPAPDHYILGINNRDLGLQRTDLSTTTRLAACLPHHSLFISESGIATRGDVITVERAGACAILVGESLLRSSDIGVKIAELMGRAVDRGSF